MRQGHVRLVVAQWNLEPGIRHVAERSGSAAAAGRRLHAEVRRHLENKRPVFMTTYKLTVL
jgi:hypothetical protein